MIENQDIYNKVVTSENLNDVHSKVIEDYQNLILKNQAILSRQWTEISEKLYKLLERCF